MATLETVASASTAHNGALWSLSWSAIQDAVLHHASALEADLNPAFKRVLTATPEGGLLQLQLQGLPTLPLVGPTGQVVATRLNTEYRNHNPYLIYSTGPDQGRRVKLWPAADGGTGRLATYNATHNVVTIRWVKHGPLASIFIVVGVLALLVIGLTVLNHFGLEATLHGLKKAPPAPTPGTPASWWANLGVLDKMLMIGGGLGVAGFAVYVYGAERIQRAGATHESININTGGPGP